MDHTRNPETMSVEELREEALYLERTAAPVEEQFYMENRFEELCQELYDRNEVL
jgi:hypothetical protein